MKASIPTAALLAIALAPMAPGQNVQPDAEPDPVLEAIREFNRRDKDSSKANEITVVLGPPAPRQSRASERPEPVLVTGKPPHDAEVSPSDPDETAEAEPTPPPEEESGDPPAGLAVRVEKIRGGEGAVDPDQVKLHAPFPAKPLASPPAGWRLEAPDDAPPLTREVELAPGAVISLNVRPHLLVPEADGAEVFSVSEPGFEAALGYSQTDTVSAILSDSIRQLDRDAERLDEAIGRLQQLLVSLPAAEPETPAEP